MGLHERYEPYLIEHAMSLRHKDWTVYPISGKTNILIPLNSIFQWNHFIELHDDTVREVSNNFLFLLIAR